MNLALPMELQLFLAYLAAHLAVYLLLVASTNGLRSERAIFLFHLLPALVSCGTMAAWAGLQQDAGALAAAVLAAGLQGVYSLSFLEAWSLAQGGYSLSILAEVEEAHRAGGDPDFSRLERIGSEKQHARIRALQRQGLVRLESGRYLLTRRGRNAAAALGMLRSWVDPAGRG